MFARRLTYALAAIAGAAVLEGMAAIWALNVANDHVLRGRVASDIQLAFEELTISKLRLRAWFTQAQLDSTTADSLRQKYQTDMRKTMATLNLLSDQTIKLDNSDATLTEYQKRQDALGVLEESVSVLEAAAAKVQPLQLGANTQQAWLKAGELFDISRARDLRQLLADSIEREASAVVRERAAADKALSWMRNLLLGAACTIALAALLLAAGFARALRRPLNELNAGAKALQQGDLAYRIPLDGIDEFSAIAASMNAMSVELSKRRADETQLRQKLEELVQARTAELQGALDALQSVDARRRRLFADISHELRTPTTAILGEAEITLRGLEKPSQDYRAALQRIVSISKQLGAVIDDLLTMARSDIDTLALNRQPLDITEPLREALQQASALAHEKNITLHLSRLPNSRLMVLADPQRLRQLLILLLDNAVHYSHVNGIVKILVQEKFNETENKAYYELQIADQGIGISAADLPMVFERSFRSQNARRHRANGSGLGLSIGLAMAHAHDGKILIHSEEGTGTIVTLQLPLLTS